MAQELFPLPFEAQKECKGVFYYLYLFSNIYFNSGTKIRSIQILKKCGHRPPILLARIPFKQQTIKPSQALALKGGLLPKKKTKNKHKPLFHYSQVLITLKLVFFPGFFNSNKSNTGE